MVRIDKVAREESRKRLRAVFDASGLSQKQFGESLKRKGYEAPSQQNVQRYLSGEVGMPESFAREVVRVYGGRVPYLLGLDNIPTELDEANMRVSAILDRAEKREALFSLLASLQRKGDGPGWELAARTQMAAPYAAAVGDDYDDTDMARNTFREYAILNREGTEKVLNRVEYERLVDKMLAYFDFEIENTVFEADINLDEKKKGR